MGGLGNLNPNAGGTSLGVPPDLVGGGGLQPLAGGKKEGGGVGKQPSDHTNFWALSF